VTRDPEPLPCSTLRDRGLLRPEHRLMDWRQWAGQSDLKRAWSMSWNLVFCDSQRYGYRWRETEFRKHALLHSETCLKKF
jgi:hypothetical protein